MWEIGEVPFSNYTFLFFFNKLEWNRVMGVIEWK